jgi:hypothetical protein
MTSLLAIFVISKLRCSGCICAQDPSASLGMTEWLPMTMGIVSCRPEFPKPVIDTAIAQVWVRKKKA